MLMCGVVNLCFSRIGIKMRDLIKEGDEVIVNFNNVQYTLCKKGIVKNVPCATGDSWIIEDELGQIHYISEGCTVTKTKKL